MASWIRVRVTREEAAAIERVRKAYGFETQAEAVRYLIRQGADMATDWRDDPLFQFKIEGFAEPGEDVTSSDIDQALYDRD